MDGQGRRGQGRRLGIDLGQARIGIAASDEDGRLAFARGAIVRRGLKWDLGEIGRQAAAEGAEEIVIGLPLRLDGSEGDAAARARRFAARVAEATGLKVVLADERLSTVEAAEQLREAGLDARRARGRIDAEAARLILQRYLDGEGPDR